MRRVALLIGVLIFMVSVHFPLSALATGQDTEKTAKEDYELQERCSRGAAEVFRQEWGNGATEDGLAVYVWNYTNHYNRKLNKCFFLVVGSGYYKDKDKEKEYAPSYTEELRDINEKKEYGHFTQFRLRKSKDIIPPICDLDRLKKHCSSRQEWEAFVKPYMEE